MKKEIIEKAEIPSGISCEYTGGSVKCKKGSDEVSRKLELEGVDVKIKDNEIVLSCLKGNRKDYKIIKTQVAHLINLMNGLSEDFEYKLEACNVHFPMSLKIEGEELVIGNFLGGKEPIHAKILSGVDVKIEGQDITITSKSRESAGQTAANFEKKTKVRGKDRRIFQDGIFITRKPGDKK